MLEWLEASGDENILTEARKTVVKELPHTQREILEEEVAEAWFETDQPGAAAWLMERSDDANRPDRIRELIRDWAEWEANAAGHWLTTMIETHGTQADPGVAMFARQIARQDPSSALEWLGAISDAGLRSKTANSLTEIWNRQGMGGRVHSLVAESSLPETDRRTVLDQLER